MSFASRRGREMASAILPFPPADAHIRGCPARTPALAARAAVSSMPPRAGACIRNDPRSASARRGGRSSPRPAHRPGLVRIPQPYGQNPSVVSGKFCKSHCGGWQSPDPLARMHTMTKRHGKSGTIDIKALLAGDEEFLRALVRTALQEVLEAEMTEALGAEKGERAAGRQGYRSGYYGRTLITRVGKLELRVPQDRAGRFSTELFERYQRSERALVGALAEMYVQGVSTRKVKAITEELCGHSFSAPSISTINKRLDQSLAQFAARPLSEAFPYLIVDARYERVREAGVIVSHAVLIAIGI